MDSHGELGRGMYLNLYTITVCLLKCFGELWTATESYGEPWVEKFILHLNMTRQELQRATESSGELRRAMEVKKSNGLIF